MSVEEFLQKLEQDTASDDDDLLSQDKESLPGSCKSQYAMKFKLDTDYAIETFIMQKKKEVIKSVTKGRFQSGFATNAGAWMQDREWKQKANPEAFKAE